MNQFVFEKRQKNTLIVFMAVGVLCLILSYFMDNGGLHQRFWTNYLLNTLYFLGIAFITTFVLHAKVLMYSGWQVTFQRLWEAFAQFLWVAMILMVPIIIGIWGHFHHLYHWTDTEALKTDVILKGKSSFLNPTWYTLGTLIVLGAWYFLFAKKYRDLSLDEDKNPDANYSQHKRIKFFSAAFMPVAAVSSSVMIWLWLMSLDAHWFSTLYAWYATASWFVGAIALTILAIIYLKGKGYLEMVTTEHLHDLGKYMFAFTIFWAYLWFSQYMLIWYANIGEETTYFHVRMRKFPVLYYGNFVLNFVLPFLILMRNDTKRKYGTLILTSAIVFFGHWFDFFQMVKVGPWQAEIEHAKHAGHDVAHLEKVKSETASLEQGMEHKTSNLESTSAEHGANNGEVKLSKWGYPEGFISGVSFPGFLELGTFLGFIGLFFYFVFGELQKASLLPKNNPYLEESTHHHVM